LVGNFNHEGHQVHEENLFVFSLAVLSDLPGMSNRRGTISLIATIGLGFAIELATNSAGNDTALLKLGALPDDGQLHGQFWRVATYSFLHFNWLHLALNVGLLWWVGRIVESQVGAAHETLIYFFSVICSAAVILLAHSWHPKDGATVGASGGIFGLLGAALILSYQQNGSQLLKTRLWIVLAVGFGISFLPNISMAGHIGGVIGGLTTALLVKPREQLT
jgi:rhomboid protease GluP